MTDQQLREQLRAAIHRLGKTREDQATKIKVKPRQIQRWLSRPPALLKRLATAGVITFNTDEQETL